MKQESFKPQKGITLDEFVPGIAGTNTRVLSDSLRNAVRRQCRQGQVT